MVAVPSGATVPNAFSSMMTCAPGLDWILRFASVALRTVTRHHHSARIATTDSASAPAPKARVLRLRLICGSTSGRVLGIALLGAISGMGLVGPSWVTIKAGEDSESRLTRSKSQRCPPLFHDTGERRKERLITFHVETGFLDCGVEVIGKFSVRTFPLLFPRVRLLPDHARLLQTPVLILGRHAAQMAQQSEFPEIPDVSCVPILHAIVTNIL